MDLHKGALMTLLTYPWWLITAVMSGLAINVFLGRYRIHRFVVALEIILSGLSLSAWLIAFAWTYFAIGMLATG